MKKRFFPLLPAYFLRSANDGLQYGGPDHCGGGPYHASPGSFHTCVAQNTLIIQHQICRFIQTEPQRISGRGGG